MRNLKRVFSLVMMAAMLCSVLVIGSSAAYKDFTDKDKITHPTAVQTLVNLGVINGKEDGSYYDPTGSLTRGEAAKLICVVLNGGQTPVLGNPDKVSYKDTADSWASPYIEYCTSLDIIAGDGQGYFRPNDTVTASQLSKMLLVALGYDAQYEGLVGTNWAAKTDALANQTGLYADLSGLVTSNVLNRDNAAQIVYNVLNADLVAYPSTNNNITSKASSTGVTVLGRYFNASEVVAYVQANDVFAVSGAKCAANKARFDVITVDGTNTVATPVYTTDISNDMVGQKVSLYVKNYGKTTASVVGAPVVSTDNKVVTTYNKLAATDVSDLLDNNDLTLSATACLLNDGTVTNAAFATTTASVAALTGWGVETTLIDNDGNGTVDYIMQTTYTLSKITAYSTSNKTLTITGPGFIDFDNVPDYADFAKGDYVLYVNFNGTYYLSNVNTVSGTPTMFTSGNKLVLDGTSYRQSALAEVTDVTGYVASSSFVNNSYTFYLDNQGNIIAYGNYVESSQNYALILASNAEQATLGGYTGYVKLLKDDGSTSTYTVNLGASATKYLNAAPANTLNYTNPATVTVTTNSSNDQKEAGMANKLAHNNTAYNVSAWSNGSGSVMANEIVTYTVNSDGTVTIAPTTTETATNIAANTEMATKSNAAYTFVSPAVTAVANGSTIYFFRDPSTGNTSVIKGISNLATTSSASVVNVAYDSDNVAKAAYVSGTATTGSEDYVYVVSGPDYYTNDNGEAVYNYTVAYSDGTTGTVTSESNGAAAGTVYSLSYSDGYAVLTTNASIIMDNCTVNYVSSSSIQVTKGGVTTAYAVDPDVAVVGVENADDSLNNVAIDQISSIATTSTVSVVLNSDGLVEYVYILTY